MNNLPVIASCSGCGACCRQMGSPPMYLIAHASGDPAHWLDEDEQRWYATMPPEALQAIEVYSEWVDSDDFRDAQPCCWLNQETGACRWYEHRPWICRDFEIGGEACREHRRVVGIN